jgi:hypothetical protein
MRSRTPETKTLNQTSLWKHLSGCANNLAKAQAAAVHADNVCAASDPDIRLIFARLQLTLGVNLEKLRMQGSLKKAESQFFNCYVDLRQFHINNPKQKV